MARTLLAQCYRADRKYQYTYRTNVRIFLPAFSQQCFADSCGLNCVAARMEPGAVGEGPARRKKTISSHNNTFQLAQHCWEELKVTDTTDSTPLTQLREISNETRCGLQKLGSLSLTTLLNKQLFFCCWEGGPYPRVPPAKVLTPDPGSDPITRVKTPAPWFPPPPIEPVQNVFLRVFFSEKEDTFSLPWIFPTKLLA